LLKALPFGKGLCLSWGTFSRLRLREDEGLEDACESRSHEEFTTS